MRKESFLVIAALIISLFISSNQAIAAPKPAAPGTVPSQPAGHADWNKIVDDAKQEGKVVVFATIVKTTQTDIIAAFAKEFGFQPEFRIMTAAEYVAKLFTERRSGIYSTDLYMGGLTTPYAQLKPAGALDTLKNALVLPEVTDGSKWYGGRVPFIDKDLMLLAFGATAQSYITINTDKVKSTDIGGYRDLLDTRWKGQIVINDPTIAGRGLDWFQVMDRLTGLDYVSKLLAQEPAVTRDRRLQVEWVARGKYAIGLAMDTSVIQEFIKNGAPLNSIWPKEGIQLGAEKGGLALINKAPHPNAAKVFVNWLLTKDGQSLWSRNEGLQSARTDVRTDFLPPDMVRDQNKKYLSMENEDWFSSKDRSRDLAKQMFGRIVQ